LTSLHTLVLHILPIYINSASLPAEASTTPCPPTPLQRALSAVTATLSHCRFPSSSPAQDEVVLLRLLKVIETVVSGPLERDLTDEGVCEMLEVGLGMGGRARLAGNVHERTRV
jgi:brefeldin A-resistance guanine nucleotide exchange factor 1